MMSVTAIFSLRDAEAGIERRARVAPGSPRILSSLPMTRSTSAISANIFACVCAAQPVTTMRASGRSRFSRRIDCRACATASLVTAQLLMTMVSERPASSASRRITSDSNALRRQPKVTTSTPCQATLANSAGSKRPSYSNIGRAGHQHVIVALAPFDGEIAAGQRDRRPCGWCASAAPPPPRSRRPPSRRPWSGPRRAPRCGS